MFPTLVRMAIVPRSTYYDKHYRQTAALIRARQPYLIKNMVGAVGLFAFVVGVCTGIFVLDSVSL